LKHIVVMNVEHADYAMIEFIEESNSENLSETCFMRTCFITRKERFCGKI